MSVAEGLAIPIRFVFGVAVARGCGSNSQNWDMQVCSRESFSTVLTQNASFEFGR
jgi:hypothetical protein